MLEQHVWFSEFRAETQLNLHRFEYKRKNTNKPRKNALKTKTIQTNDFSLPYFWPYIRGFSGSSGIILESFPLMLTPEGLKD